MYSFLVLTDVVLFSAVDCDSDPPEVVYLPAELKVLTGAGHFRLQRTDRFLPGNASLSSRAETFLFLHRRLAAKPTIQAAYPPFTAQQVISWPSSEQWAWNGFQGSFPTELRLSLSLSLPPRWFQLTPPKSKMSLSPGMSALCPLKARSRLTSRTPGSSSTSRGRTGCRHSRPCRVSRCTSSTRQRLSTEPASSRWVPPAGGVLACQAARWLAPRSLRKPMRS